MSSRTLIWISLGLAAALFPVAAGATDFDYEDDGILQPVGDLLFGNSFGQYFWFSTESSAFDTIAVQMVSPAPNQFENPAFRNFFGAVWQQTYINSSRTIAAAGGPAINSMIFDLWFPGDPIQSFQFKMQAFSKGTVVSKKLVEYKVQDGGYSWSISSAPAAAAIPIPEAPAAALLLAGLGLVGVRRRRRKP